MQYNPYQTNHMPHQAQPEHRVLVDLVTKVPSVEQRANNLQMKPEQYRSAKSKLKQMLK